MSLQVYRKKRDFRKTAEPKGKARKRSRRRRSVFVIQKHDATQLHYDLRLEINGTLASWAVPKGPSLDPSQKRLAVHVEDHPVEYADFEGVIPKDQYGGGTVMLWDKGSWTPKEDDPIKALERGKISFELEGEKLRGGWTLTRMKGRPGNGDSNDNWLLLKRDDDAASRGGQSILQTQPNSVSTGRTLHEIAGDEGTKGGRHEGTQARKNTRNSELGTRNSRKKSPAALPKAVEAPMPRTTTPQLCTLAEQAPAGDDWIHEIKFDGYRLLARRTKSSVRLFTRTGKDWTDRFRDIAEAVEKLPVTTAVLDGEATILDREGRTSFQKLQQAIKGRSYSNLVFYVFDLLYLDGYDLRRAPLLERKRLLQKLLPDGDECILRFSEHVRGSGQAVQENACELALEGIISKRVDSPYIAGRSRTWLKIKCTCRQEFVVIGYSPPAGTRKHFGALLLGAYGGDDRLFYVGRVGTGFSAATLRDISRRMKPLERKTCPADEPPTPSEGRGVKWIRPELVAEVEFSEWTEDGRLRHPSFQGLREDKDPESVMLESAAPTKTATRRAAAEAKQAQRDGRRQRESSASGGRKTPSRGSSANSNTTVAGVNISNADRVLYPEQGATKGDLARYYKSIAEHMLPHIRDSPLSVVRCPRGRARHCFFQKHLRETLSDPVKAIKVKEKSQTAEYIGVDSTAGLVTLIQFGVLEVHRWGATKRNLEKPDRMVFDLDPAEDATFDQVKQAALLVREELEAVDLDSYLQTTGGKGVHVVVPLRPGAGWDEVKAFAGAVAKAIASHQPEQYVATMSKKKRKGRVFIDYFRNGRGATFIAPYSTRARAGAPVAMPLRWDELDKLRTPAQYTIDNVAKRLEHVDAWLDFFRKRQQLTASRLRTLGL